MPFLPAFSMYGSTVGSAFENNKIMGFRKLVITLSVDPTEDDLYLQLFEGLFPTDYLETVLLEETNQSIEGEPVTYGELLHWIGLWIIMSTCDGSDRCSFWSNKNPDIFEGRHFCLQQFMSRYWLDSILSATKYTNNNPPAYKDRFWEVRQLLESWNNNMATNFIPSWINVIDESMSKWINEYTYPGFMFVPWKPWAFGNEYHDARCCESDILWQVDLREGKDRPPQAGDKEYDNLGKTAGTLMRLTKPIQGTGKLFVLDSGFCVLQALVELAKVGVFAHALVKKRLYWPKHVPGDKIIEHFKDKAVGYVDARQGNLDGIPFYLYGMKEPDYTMIIMATYGTLQRMGPEKTWTFKLNNKKTATTFKYPEVVSNHYCYHDMIDNHNGMHMHPIALEETWLTSRWPNRVFSFLLAVTVVNVQNAATYFFNKEKNRCTHCQTFNCKGFNIQQTYEECGGANVLET